jgi:capsular exopolysaccharide synthesis family protein
MSRIEEALRRVHGTEPTAASDQSVESFRSPWEFQGGATATATAPAPAHTPTVVERRPREATPTDALDLREPLGRRDGAVSGFNSQWKERLVVSPEVDPYLVEQFRRLAATLHQAQAGNGIRTVMVTSATPGDGKTQTAINLALILSESYGRQVLLVDADLRRPAIRDVAHIPDVIGLADGLRAKSEQKLTVFPITRQLSLLPAGRPDPDPMSGLTSARMRRILSDASNRFDWVIVDAPPVGTVADASILAEMVDASLLVVRANHSEHALVQKAVDAIGRERILGVVLNAVETVDDAGYAQYYQRPSEDQSLARS